jgi:hypothetical protein
MSALEMESKVMESSKYLSFQAAQNVLRLEGYLSAEQLAAVISSNSDKVLPAELRDYLVGFLRGEKKAKRGRKRQPKAFWDFFLAGNIHVYHAKLHECQEQQRRSKSAARATGSILPRGDSPQERAIEFFHGHLRKQLGNETEQIRKEVTLMSARRLHNLMSSMGWLRRSK